MARRQRFDARYYRRFYLRPSTRAQDPASARRKARFLSAYLAHLGMPVRSVLDIGCGLGWTLKALGRLHPRARLVGVEASDYLCRTRGWRNGSVVDWPARTPFDLVVCDDVLPSLTDRDCARALANLAKLSRGALFVGILTREDWRRCDRRRTDPHVHLRPASWYRKRLERRFVPVGGGLYLKKPLDVTLWSLEIGR